MLPKRLEGDSIEKSKAKWRREFLMAFEFTAKTIL